MTGRITHVATPPDSAIRLFSGGFFDYAAPESSVFTIEDIAHSLSLLCRFCGHVPRPYSVAQHSVEVSKIVPAPMALAGLLHDAPEAFLADIPKPLKAVLPDYREMEDRVGRVVLAAFGVPIIPQEVKLADQRILAAEQRFFFPGADTSWVDGIPGTPAPSLFAPKSPTEVRDMFLHRFHELMVNRSTGIHP